MYAGIHCDWSSDVCSSDLAKNVELDERHDTQMGVILSFVLSALIAEIVRLIAAWWRDSHANRCLLMAYQRELPDE
jgi:hypothetical protein